MQSGKQRKAEIKARRVSREAAEQKLQSTQQLPQVSPRMVSCDVENLGPFNQFSVPTFVERGYYMDVLFQCASCRIQEAWSATQQKWWYETAKGAVDSRAKLCNPCRRVERERKAEARRIHIEGVAAKLAKRHEA